MAGVLGPVHFCPKWDSSNGQSLRWSSPSDWWRHSRSCVTVGESSYSILLLSPFPVPGVTPQLHSEDCPLHAYSCSLPFSFHRHYCPIPVNLLHFKFPENPKWLRRILDEAQCLNSYLVGSEEPLNMKSHDQIWIYKSNSVAEWGMNQWGANGLVKRPLKRTAFIGTRFWQEATGSIYNLLRMHSWSQQPPFKTSYKNTSTNA